MNIVITGASNGIGLALARHYAGSHQVFNLDNQAPVARVGQFIRCDLTSDRAITAAVSQLPTHIDLLIHNAGVMRRGELLDTEPDDMDLLYRVFLRGPWLLTRLLRQRRLHVALISSFHVSEHSTNPAPYVLFKSTATAFAQLLAQPTTICYMGPVETELASYGKRATAAARALRITPEAAAGWIVKAIDAKQDLHYSAKTRRYRLRGR